ncbi:MAG TPA: hypothetical protein P5556_00890 [Candidatus Gastranaerophilales bacterium]|nr:hypothetical protein [Candidatus Gastranaerophilales bacterium]
MIQDKVLKIIKGLNIFTLDDIAVMTDLNENEIAKILDKLLSDKIIQKLSWDKYRHIPNVRKTKRPQLRKGIIGFETASKNFMREAENKCTASTFKSYKCSLNKHLIPFFIEFRVTQIKPENIDQFIEQKLTEGLSPKSIDNIVKLLGSILEKSLKDRYIPFNPARAVRRF